MKIRCIVGTAAIALAGAWCPGAVAQTDSGGGVIHLHMPGQAIHLHPIPHRAPTQTSHAAMGANGGEAVATPESPAAAPAALESPTSAAPPKSVRHHPASGQPAIPFNFGDEGADSPTGSAPAPQVPPPVQTAALPPHPAVPAHSSAAEAAHAGLTKRGAVLFSKGASNPSPAQFNGVKVLASDLASALESGGARIELDAFGGTPGDKSSEARRLSLRRALAVRQLLIDDGVPSSRIDVRALGGTDDKGPADRVDVFVRAG